MQVVLEGVDVVVAASPEVGTGLGGVVLLGQDLGVHPDDEDILVVGAIEDGELAAGGQGGSGPPQEVVGGLCRRGLLEGHDAAPLRVHPRHDVLDRPVLSGGVKCLEDDEHGVGPGSPQQLLGAFELPGEGRQVLVGHLLAGLVRPVTGSFCGPGGAHVLGAASVQPRGLTRLDAQL